MARGRAVDVQIEKLLPSMEEYFVVGMMSKDEVRELAQKRTAAEYKLLAKPLLLLDVQQAIKLEIALEMQVAEYAQRTQVKMKHRWDVLDRIEKIYRDAMHKLRRQPADVEALSEEFLQFCAKFNRTAAISKFYTERLQKNPRDRRAWYEASLWELRQGNSDQARALLKKARALLPNDVKLWTASLEVELEHVGPLLKGIRLDKDPKKLEKLAANEALHKIVSELALAKLLLKEFLQSSASHEAKRELLCECLRLCRKFRYSLPVVDTCLEEMSRGAFSPSEASLVPEMVLSGVHDLLTPLEFAAKTHSATDEKRDDTRASLGAASILWGLATRSVSASELWNALLRHIQTMKIADDLRQSLIRVLFLGDEHDPMRSRLLELQHDARFARVLQSIAGGSAADEAATSSAPVVVIAEAVQSFPADHPLRTLAAKVMSTRLTSAASVSSIDEALNVYDMSTCGDQFSTDQARSFLEGSIKRFAEDPRSWELHVRKLRLVAKLPPQQSKHVALVAKQAIASVQQHVLRVKSSGSDVDLFRGLEALTQLCLEYKALSVAEIEAAVLKAPPFPAKCVQLCIDARLRELEETNSASRAPLVVSTRSLFERLVKRVAELGSSVTIGSKRSRETVYASSESECDAWVRYVLFERKFGSLQHAHDVVNRALKSVQDPQAFSVALNSGGAGRHGANSSSRLIIQQ